MYNAQHFNTLFDTKEFIFTATNIEREVWKKNWTEYYKS
jgi:hypothetical protein